jgi:endonuclease/exonuclease/phosphatase (EEP) superfamily protein YafD
VHLHWPIGAENVRLRNAELQALAALARGIDEPLLIGGDFNITAWSPVFAAALGDAPVRDCARGQGLVGSWPSFFPPAAIRIDHCLASPHWHVRRVAAGPGLGSDHRPMVTDLELRRRGPSTGADPRRDAGTGGSPAQAQAAAPAPSRAR